MTSGLRGRWLRVTLILNDSTRDSLTRGAMMSEPFDPYHKWLGIAPKDQPPHHYRLLGIDPFESDRDVIDAAANRVMSYLKDLAVGDDAAHSQQMMNEVMQARLCLLNHDRKAAYDAELRAKLDSKQPPPPRAAADREFSSGKAETVPVVHVDDHAVKPSAAKHRGVSWQVVAIGAGVFCALAAVVLIVVAITAVRRDEPPVLSPLPNNPQSTGDDRSAEVASEESPSAGVPTNGNDGQKNTSNDTEAKIAADEPLTIDTAETTEPPLKTEASERPSDIELSTPLADSNSIDPPIEAPATQPIPTVQDQLSARPNVLKEFGNAIADANSDDERTDLAEQILNAASDGRRAGADRFVLLLEGLKLAVIAKNAALAKQFTNRILRDFNIETNEPNPTSLELKAALFAELRERAETPADFAVIADRALALLDEAASDDRRELAIRLASLALASARKAADDELARRATLRLLEVQ